MEEKSKSQKNVVDLWFTKWSTDHITPEFHAKLSILLPSIDLKIDRYHNNYCNQLLHQSGQNTVIIFVTSPRRATLRRAIMVSYVKLTEEEIIESIKYTARKHSLSEKFKRNKRRV